MKRLILCVAIASALGLTGCGEDSYNELKDKTEPLIPESRMVFDPANSKVPLPNDLLFSGTKDGTLSIPGESSGNYTDPQIALGALDGWSTTSPISIDIDLAKDHDGTQLTLMAASVAQPGAVRMFEATVGGALSSDPECKAKPSVSACKVGAELQFGVDFVSTASGNKVVIIPLKPLKAGQSYIYATTKLIQDSEGRGIAPSTTYNTLKMDINTLPLETPDQLMLQTLINSYEKGIAAAHNVDTSTISYSGLFTTQSVANVYEITKLLMAQGAPYAPSFAQMPTPTGYTVAEMLKLPPNPSDPVYVVSNLADVYTAKIKLPIYGDCSSVSCLSAEGKPLINGRWKAQGDSPVSVLLALQAGTLSQTNFGMQAVANGIANPADALANPTLMAGKTWLLDDGTAVDKTKHLTKFNPIPAIKGYETVSVLISMPNAAKLAAFYQQQNMSFIPPTSGWPTTIALHGLGGGKEMSLAYAGSYAAMGVATVAIDMPLHGARSFDANGDGIYEVSATDPSFGEVIGTPDAFKNGNPLVFVNISSTLSVRDNFRQATMDHLGVRLALTGLAQGLAQANQPQVFDVSKISAQGLSLGAIVGTDFATYASTGMRNPTTGEALPNPYVINAASLVAPAGGLAGAFAGSATFGPVLFNNVTASATFKALVDKANTAGYEPGSPEYAALVQAVYAQFIPTFAFAVQTAVDSADPVNHAGMLKATGLPVHLIEVAGDGNGNLADQVLPNSVDNFPLSGTEPLISAMGLPCVDATTKGLGVVRFSKGHHSSIVDPSEKSSTDGMAAAATVEMQTQVATYASTAGKGEATIYVTDPSVIATCPN
ncbi:VolA/Pla-1 family phospholipase [Shewanella xiamenensis]|uniref:VolA/Pla-1 family phospholipase n=1 Tax=Shewanella xiamenensis TaxID=332186 RepID=UPI0024A73E67|nr:VolA/Pla-1 family phospholipase [Shewanella xiamenensis]MDI5835052.1 lipase [Shewanella xiamenensis]MDI5839175.1 lipase [Shewanella xiamenensis]MDI5843270.1 lipase [Shewanella xiamenensis]MDI5847863.1 lipase [Shewanella xiamenensis]MDI5859038.1 lipase [Shewanella xiamenensis]